MRLRRHPSPPMSARHQNMRFGKAEQTHYEATEHQPRTERAGYLPACLMQVPKHGTETSSEPRFIGSLCASAHKKADARRIVPGRSRGRFRSGGPAPGIGAVLASRAALGPLETCAEILGVRLAGGSRYCFRSTTANLSGATSAGTNRLAKPHILKSRAQAWPWLSLMI